MIIKIIFNENNNSEGVKSYHPFGILNKGFLLIIIMSALQAYW